MTSFQLSERYNAQTLLWDSCRLLVGSCRLLSAVGRHLSALLPHLLIALALVATICVAAAVVAMVPPAFWTGLLITGAFGWATYPRPRNVVRA